MKSKARILLRILKLPLALAVVMGSVSLVLFTGCTASASPAPLYKRITNDQTQDWDPRIDDGQVVWFRKTEDPDVRSIMLYDGGSITEIATVNADQYLLVDLEIDNGWIFWDDKDDDDGDYEKWLYSPISYQVVQISDDAVYDYGYYKFEDGKVLWESKDGLMFYNGYQTVKLVDAGDYDNFAFQDGCVVWEQGTTAFNRRVWIYDGADFTNLSSAGGAAGFMMHKLDNRHPERCTHDGQVVWMAHDGSDWEILFYDGGTVHRLTNNDVTDSGPQVHSGRVAWCNNYNSLYIYNGTEEILISDAIYTTSIDYYLYAGGLLWWRSDNSLMLYEPGAGSSRLLQDYAEGYEWLNIKGFDDKGVLWFIRDSSNNYTLKLYDGSEVKVLATVQDPLDGDDWYFDRCIHYQGGYAAWNEYRQNTVDCTHWVCDPDCHKEVTQGAYLDQEVFYYDALTGEVRQLTSDTVLDYADVGGCSATCPKASCLDNGLAVWCAHTLSPSLPDCPSGDPPLLGRRWRDIFMGGQPVDDLSVSAQDISLDQILRDGKRVTLDAAVHNLGQYSVSNVKVAFLVDSESKGQQTIPSLAPGASTQVSFEWDVTWSIKDKLRNDTKIEVVVDPDDEIYEISEANNRATRRIPRLQKGRKRDNVDGKGFLVASGEIVPYAVPIGIWFDDDADTAEDGLPTRHYNPIATSQDVLDDIERDFNGPQYPRGIDRLEAEDFVNPDAKDTITLYWDASPGIVFVQGHYPCMIAGAPIASYLNWPMLPSDLLPSFPDIVRDIISELGVTYVLVIAATQEDSDAMVTWLGALDLPAGKNLLVKDYAVEPLADDETAGAFKETLEAFGERPSSIVVANSWVGSSLAAAPLAAFNKSVVLDVSDEIPEALSYVADNYLDLQFFIGSRVSDIIDDPGDDHDIKGFIQKYMAPGPVTVYLVGTVEWLPFGIEREPAEFDASDSDKDWIASDYRYYDAHPAIVPGGRMPLPGEDNINYVAMALQFDVLPVGNRDKGDGWEDNILGAGIYNISGKHLWWQHRIWWLDSVIYQLRDLSAKAPDMEITRFFEDPWVHNGGWGENWYRFDNDWAYLIEDGLIKEAPLFWDIRPPLENPTGGGYRGNRRNDDGDKVGYESVFSIERIIDNNDNGVYDAGDTILNEGLVPGIQAGSFEEIPQLTIDEEVWDGFDNDGDGTVDEDCSYWHLLQLVEVYNEALYPTDPTAPDLEPGDYIDLIDTKLIEHLGGQGLIIYSGHAWTTKWAMRNMGGTCDPPGAAPPKTTDDRTDDQTNLRYDEVPDMAPSLVIASACGSSRAWEANNIAKAFLNKGALAYIGSTAIAYGSSDEFRQQMFNNIVAGKLHIGLAFKSAVDNLAANGLWARKFGEDNKYADKTRYEFNLFGLGSTEVDSGEGGEQRVTLVTFGTPAYDSDAMRWSQDITFDIPAPIEIEDAQGNVIQIFLPYDLLTYFSDTADYPALRLLPFNYHLPIGGRVLDVSLIEATVHKVYDFSLYKVTDKPKWPPEETEPDASLLSEQEPELYQGSLYPDVLFVSDSRYDSLTNSDLIYGSVAAFQVDGGIPQTTVYDRIVLRVTYTAPLGLEETHSVDGTDLTVQATIVSTDGEQHTVIPKLSIETVGGILHKEISLEEVTVDQTPQTVNFEVSDIRLYRYVGRISLSEAGVLAAEVTFTEVAPAIPLDPNLEAAIRATLGKPSGPICADDLEALTSLDAGEKGIIDLSGIEYCSNLTELHLEGNRISDISPLSSLVKLTGLNLNRNQVTDISALSGLASLTQLYLQKNQITDIGPLVNNFGLGEGDSLDMRDNPLSATSRTDFMPQLEARGVSVQFQVAIGDINDDTNLDLVDAILAIQILSRTTSGQIVYKSCDVNGDGKIGLEEAIYILQRLSEFR